MLEFDIVSQPIKTSLCKLALSVSMTDWISDAYEQFCVEYAGIISREDKLRLSNLAFKATVLRQLCAQRTVRRHTQLMPKTSIEGFQRLLVYRDASCSHMVHRTFLPVGNCVHMPQFPWISGYGKSMSLLLIDNAVLVAHYMSLNCTGFSKMQTFPVQSPNCTRVKDDLYVVPAEFAMLRPIGWRTLRCYDDPMDVLEECDVIAHRWVPSGHQMPAPRLDPQGLESRKYWMMLDYHGTNHSVTLSWTACRVKSGTSQVRFYSEPSNECDVVHFYIPCNECVTLTSTRPQKWCFECEQEKTRGFELNS